MKLDVLIRADVVVSLSGIVRSGHVPGQPLHEPRIWTLFYGHVSTAGLVG